MTNKEKRAIKLNSENFTVAQIARIMEESNSSVYWILRKKYKVSQGYKGNVESVGRHGHEFEAMSPEKELEITIRGLLRIAGNDQFTYNRRVGCIKQAIIYRKQLARLRNEH